MSVLGMAELQSATFYFAQLAVKTHKWCRPVQPLARGTDLERMERGVACQSQAPDVQSSPVAQEEATRPQNTFGWEAQYEEAHSTARRGGRRVCFGVVGHRRR